ncbi:MAG: sensor histidine kinase [Deltaproteobacteria bacterium]|nr:sensor histidine kinase [Deltaproteobacteria bacterium]
MLFFQKKLFFKLLGFLIPTSIIGVALTTLFLTEISRQFSRSQAGSFCEYLSEDMGSRIQFFLDQLGDTLELIATSIELGKPGELQQKVTLLGIRDDLPYVRFASLIERDGQVGLSSTTRKSEVMDKYRRLEFGDRIFSGPCLTSILRDEEGFPLMYATVPVHFRQRVERILFLELDARYFYQMFTSMVGLPGIILELIESKGMVVATNLVQNTFEASHVPYAYYLSHVGKGQRNRWEEEIQGEENLIHMRFYPETGWVFVVRGVYSRLFAQKAELYMESILIGAFMIWLCTVVGMYAARRFLKPIRSLHESAIAISRGDFSQKVNATSHDEVGRLAWDFDLMRSNLLDHIERELKAVEEKARLQNLAAMGEAASKVNHEIGNRLSNISMLLDLHRNQGISGSGQAFFQAIEQNVERIDQICRDFSRFSRSKFIHPEILPVQSFLSSIVEQNRLVLEKYGVTAELEVESDLPAIWADPGLLEHVFNNLIHNSLDAMSEGGTIHISARAWDHRLVVDFLDSGPGIAKEMHQTIFDPFFTTKRGKGTGLGLSIVRSVVQAHEGEVNCVEDGGGAHFVLTFPLWRSQGKKRTLEPEIPKVREETIEREARTS